MMQFTALLTLSLVVTAAAGPLRPLERKNVPQPLVPWIDWVLAGHEEAQCPFFQGNADNRVCAWPTRLSLKLKKNGGTFSQKWRLYAEGWVVLPGDLKNWPQYVTVDEKPAPILNRGGKPAVLLKEGSHTVAGTFTWDSLPEMLNTPAETGLLSLTVNEEKVLFPVHDEQGRIWLQRTRKEEKIESRLEVIVHRMVIDSIPLRLVTSVQLKVSGKNREVLLGKALPSGFVPQDLQSALPVRVEPDGRLRIQVRAGNWNIQLTARHEGPVNEISLGEPGGPWDEAEPWVFNARTHLRLVTVEGVRTVDPQQTELPGNWRNFPAYLMVPGDSMKLLERRRGDSDPAPDRLQLERTFWLDFDGRGLSVSDTLAGALSRSWRLEMEPGTTLGRVAAGGQDRFITSLKEGGPAGIEIRQGTVDLEADSRIEGGHWNVPAVSWRHDFDTLTGKLMLPPGWRLIHATGVDKASPTWVTTWTLLDIFLVLIISLSFGRLWGARWGSASLLFLGLAWHQPQAPRWIWLFILVGEALMRALPEGKIKKATAAYRAGAWIILFLLGVVFIVTQIRTGVYPQLERRQGWMQPASMPATLAAGFAGKADKGLLGEPMEMQAEAADYATQDVKSLSMLRRSYKSAGSAPAASAPAQRNTIILDPKSHVSTGPGMPTWQWNTVHLTWQGPVKSDQRLRLLLISPRVHLALSVLRVVLTVLLALLLFGMPLAQWRSGLKQRGGWAKALAWFFPALLLLPWLTPPAAAASSDMPTPEILNELRTRLLIKPDCAPECAEVPRMLLEAAGNTLRIRLDVNAAARTAVPLPGGAKQWTPSAILVDASPAAGLMRSNDGKLWATLSPGLHQVVLEGSLPDRETIQLALPLKPHRVEAAAYGWIIDGIHEDGLVSGNLQLTKVRKEKSTGKYTLEPGSLPPFVAVERRITLGLSWQVHTTVSRMTPPGTPIVVEVPLIEGESVTTADVRVKDGKVSVSMNPQSHKVSWFSVLKEAPRLELKAPQGIPWIETWHLDVSPIWHVEPAGIPKIHRPAQGAVRVQDWSPWPGETVTLEISRPQGVPGQTLTIDNSRLDVHPGLRATDATLSLSVRSSRGGEHSLNLPEDATLQAVRIDNIIRPIRQEGRKVTLPILPGSHNASVTWRQDGGIGLFYRTPEVDLGAQSVNSSLTVTMPADRWTLILGGPPLGPAVLFWSLLSAFLIICIGLGRVTLTPLRAQHWFLLSLGLTQIRVVVAAVIVAWLIALGARKAYPREHAREFNPIQIGLVFLTMIALGCLYSAITHGLLGLPDMQISGNGSTAQNLIWYQDRSGSVLPRAWTLSVPLMVYRAAMLTWALWLASSLLVWLKWGWACFNEEGIWKKFPSKTLQPAAPAPPPVEPKEKE